MSIMSFRPLPAAKPNLSSVPQLTLNHSFACALALALTTITITLFTLIHAPPISTNPLPTILFDKFHRKLPLLDVIPRMHREIATS
jgi:hypothetical protein